MVAGHRFDPTVLRAYDIRGIVGQTLGEDDAHAVGRAFGSVIARQGGRRVCLGFDGRLTSPRLESAAADGLAASGLRVVRIGLGPTPMLYFAVHHLDGDGGLMVTGSHNPPSYNGFKMVAGKRAFFGEDIVELGQIAAAGDFVEGAGETEEIDVEAAYVARLVADFDGGRDLAVAWDPGHGAASAVLDALTAELPGRHELINATIDGNFPAHHPDPTVAENLRQLQEVVARTSCDLGIALDGDGDRIGVVDDRGRVLWADQLLALLAREVLAGHPGATVISDVKSSQILFDEIARLGGTPLMWRTGHSLIKSKMADVGAPLAGEMSGHIFFADRYYGYDDALYAAVRLLGFVAASDVSLAELRDQLPQMSNTPELRFPCPEERKFAVVDEVRGRLEADGAKVNAIDGVRVTTPDGWWLLRASNTQDALVARCEAADEAALDRLKDHLASALETSGIEAPL